MADGFAEKSILEVKCRRPHIQNCSEDSLYS